MPSIEPRILLEVVPDLAMNLLTWPVGTGPVQLTPAGFGGFLALAVRPGAGRPLRSIMRTLCILVVAVAIGGGITAAQAQRKGTQQNGQQDSATSALKAQIDAREQEAKDQAYKDALKRIPASNEKQDPWKNAR